MVVQRESPTRRELHMWRFTPGYSTLVRPSLLGGAASLFDFAGVFAPRVRLGSPKDCDAEALASDWEAIGRDLWVAMSTMSPNPEPSDKG